MTASYQSLVGLFSFFRDAAWAAILIGLILPPAGMFLHLRHGLFLGAALPQLAGLGFVIGESLGISSLISTSTVLALFSIVAAWKPIEDHNRGYLDSAIALGYAVSMAGIVLLLALTNAEAHAAELLLKGSVLAVTSRDVYLLACLGIPLVIVLYVLRRRFFLVSLDPETGQTLGIPVRLYDALLFFSIGLGVTLTLVQAGALACFAFLSIPPLCAIKICRRVGSIFAVSIFFGVVGAIGGLILALAKDLPVGPSMVSILLLLFGFSAFYERLRIGAS